MSTNFKFCLLILMVSVAVIASPTSLHDRASATQLVRNPGFEAKKFDPWTRTGGNCDHCSRNFTAEVFKNGDHIGANTPFGNQFLYVNAAFDGDIEVYQYIPGLVQNATYTFSFKHRRGRNPGRVGGLYIYILHNPWGYHPKHFKIFEGSSGDTRTWKTETTNFTMKFKNAGYLYMVYNYGVSYIDEVHITPVDGPVTK